MKKFLFIIVILIGVLSLVGCDQDLVSFFLSIGGSNEQEAVKVDLSKKEPVNL